MATSESNEGNAGSTHGAGRRRSRLRRQFGQPSGLLGALVGRLMARKNAAMNRAAVELLDVRSTDRVLEIGFGPGVAVQELSSRATEGLVAGIDPSDVMMRQATRRNQQAIDAGRVVLQFGTAAALPFDNETFDKVLAVNTFHHWGSTETGLLEVRRVIRPGGTLLLGLRMALAQPRILSAPGWTDEQLDEVRAQLLGAGFRDVHTVERTADRRITCMFATR